MWSESGDTLMVKPQDFLVSWIHARKQEESRMTGSFWRKQLEVPLHADGQGLGAGGDLLPNFGQLRFYLLVRDPSGDVEHTSGEKSGLEIKA